jgi:hypothetical protein
LLLSPGREYGSRGVRTSAKFGANVLNAGQLKSSRKVGTAVGAERENEITKRTGQIIWPQMNSDEHGFWVGGANGEIRPHSSGSGPARR